MKTPIVIHRPAKDRTVLELGGDRLVLFSFNTPVAVWSGKTGFLVTAAWYSKTTTSHISWWLGGKIYRYVTQDVINQFTLVTCDDIPAIDDKIIDHRTDKRLAKRRHNYTYQNK